MGRPKKATVKALALMISLIICSNLAFMTFRPSAARCQKD